MPQIPQLVSTLKKQLKAQGLTYVQVASHLELSEASIKRLFAEENFSLQRLEQICTLLGMELSELFRLMQEEQHRLRQLTWEQEQEIASDVLLLMITACVINGFSYEQILDRYRIEKTECIRKLAHLDRLKIIELLPNNRIKLLISPDFHWLANGPIQQFFQAKVEQEFFSSKFDQSHEKLLVLNGFLSNECNARLQQKMDKLAREFAELCDEDKPMPIQKRLGHTAVLALRHWDYKIFSKYIK